MAVTVFQSTSTLKENVLVESTARQHTITIDEPKQLGGTDTGMNPVELLLAALGACQTIAAQTFAKKFDVSYEELYVEVEGDLDIDGFLDKADVRPGFSEIRYKVHLTSQAPQDKIDAFLAFVENHCPVGDTLANGVKLVSQGAVVTTPQL